MKYAALALGCALFASSPVMAAETLTNETVIQLVGAGLGNEAVIAKIKASEGKYVLNTADLIALKNAGVGSDVIAAMIEASAPKSTAPALSLTDIDPMTPHPSGVYLIDKSANRLNRIDPTMSSQAKTGGIWGYALTGGIASMSIKVAIAGDKARIVARSAIPSFYFFFDESNPATSNLSSSWAAGSALTVTSPNEFSLVRLMEKKGRREARVGSTNIGGSKTGVMDKDRILFDYEMVRPGVYKVTPKQTLQGGQYGFIYALAGGGTGGAMTARIFDFSIL